MTYNVKVVVWRESALAFYLRLPDSKQSVVVGFANDFGVVIISRHPDKVEIYVKVTIKP